MDALQLARMRVASSKSRVLLGWVKWYRGISPARLARSVEAHKRFLARREARMRVILHTLLESAHGPHARVKLSRVRRTRTDGMCLRVIGLALM